MSRIHDFIVVRWMGRDDLISMMASMMITYIALMGAVLVAFALIDVPFQIHAFKKKMMMSLKEVKDEFKQTEGNPEMKGKMKRRQREIAESRHIPDTKNATVVFTNPTHFSVAIFFDKTTLDIPRVVSMGADNNAFRIREVATQNLIPILHIPELARSLYSYGKIGHPIPDDLFSPVAAVLSYLMSLEDPMGYDVGEISDHIEIPENMQVDPQDLE